jgi:hypothetical protein
VPIHYDAYILKELGACATGINDSGWIVGFTEKVPGQPVSAWWIPTVSSGQGPQHNFIQGPAGKPAGGIDNLGDIILPNGTLFNTLFNSNPAAGPLPFATVPILSNDQVGIALNDRQMVVSGNVIYNWLTQEVVATMPFTDTTSYAMDNLGNVVGVGFAPNEEPGYGIGAFFYTAGYDYNYGGPPGQAYFDNTVQLFDLNDYGIMVGVVFGPPTTAFWQDNHAPMSGDSGGLIALPNTNEQSLSFATAINSTGTIVGTVVGAPTPQSEYAFVAPASPDLYGASLLGEIPGFDLNTLANKPTEWSLVAANDINNPGSIVGQARGPGGRLAGFVANPRRTLRGLSDPPHPMSEGEVRSQIGRLTAEGAFRVQNKRSARPPLTEVQKRQRAKVLKLIGRS